MIELNLKINDYYKAFLVMLFGQVHPKFSVFNNNNLQINKQLDNKHLIILWLKHNNNNTKRTSYITQKWSLLINR